MNEISYNMNWNSMSDRAISNTIGEFVRHHRLSQNKSQNEVAKAADISRSTLSLLERGETVTLATFLQVLRVLDLLYIIDSFKINEQISPIELAKLDREKRKRASAKKNTTKNKSDW